MLPAGVLRKGQRFPTAALLDRQIRSPCSEAEPLTKGLTGNSPKKGGFLFGAPCGSATRRPADPSKRGRANPLALERSGTPSEGATRNSPFIRGVLIYLEKVLKLVRVSAPYGGASRRPADPSKRGHPRKGDWRESARLFRPPEGQTQRWKKKSRCPFVGICAVLRLLSNRAVSPVKA